MLKEGLFNRAAAAYAMQILTTPRAIRALEEVVKDKLERPRVRGEAAEALAHSHRRRSHDVLLEGLGDSGKDVRFWCAFALGQMAEKKGYSRSKKPCREGQENGEGISFCGPGSC